MLSITDLLDLKAPVILASKSPRRKNLLNSLGLEFEVIASEIDEDIDGNISPDEYCVRLAWTKAEYVAKSLNYEAIVVGADTIVVIDGKIINKPESENQAYDFLRLLSGKTHKVYTGIAILNSLSKKFYKDYQITNVTFRELDDKEIYAYINSGSPMDKAGAYGIQDDFGAVFVKHIEGCYYNIVGLPLELLYSSLKKFTQN